MILICYPNNKVYSDLQPFKLLGTNEDYDIPAVRPAPYGKTIDDVEIYTKNGDTIKAFYTTLNMEERAEHNRQYQLEYQREHRKPRYSDMKKSAMMTGLFSLLNMKG